VGNRRRGGHAILVVDKTSLKLLNATLRMSEILVRNISGESALDWTIVFLAQMADKRRRFVVVEDVLGRRAPHPDSDVVYFLSPLSIDAMLKDWAGPMLLYAHAHVFFLSGKLAVAIAKWGFGLEV
jgi:hypothetical protein